ncbi:MAG: hypothetical protein K2Y27_17255 [Xanthobacteraceae bacterium]|nr:hypothetical protein [Xanthobacteraceae bacterium]
MREKIVVRSIRYDRNKERSYQLARMVAAKLVENPALIEEGRKYLERHVKDAPGQHRRYELWMRILALNAGQIASRLMADNAEGEFLRDTRPVFYIPSNAERQAVHASVRRSFS